MNHPDTQFLRAFAIILVLNSHLDKYYPIPYIATGGAIGNSLFFFLSAYGLYISQQTHSRRFVEWFSHRIARIYPSLWIVLISLYMPVLISQGKLSYSTVSTFIGNFFNPPFWFLQALLVYCLLGFPLFKSSDKRHLVALFAILSIFYIGCYISILDLSRWTVEESPFDLIHYFIVFLFGIYIAKVNNIVSYSGLSDFLVFILLISIFYGHKYCMLNNVYLEYQFLQQLLIYPILYSLMKISRCPLIVTHLTHTKCLSRSVDFFANTTLEIYMVHQTISKSILYLHLSFPINLIVFLAITFLLSAIVNRLASAVRGRFQ